MIDWQMIALKLRKHAPLSTISVKLGRSKSWLPEIARGEIVEPKFSDGTALLDYAADVLGDLREFRT